MKQKNGKFVCHMDVYQVERNLILKGKIAAALSFNLRIWAVWHVNLPYAWVEKWMKEYLNITC